jgi:hypothetical protein
MGVLVHSHEEDCAGPEVLPVLTLMYGCLLTRDV